MTALIRFTQGSELPDVRFTWKDSSGVVIDFSTGYTFTFKVGSTPVFSKTTLITGAAAAPNVTVAFAAGELDAIPLGTYKGQLWARRTADSKDRDPLPFIFEIVQAIA